jgi:hypothetical protein
VEGNIGASGSDENLKPNEPGGEQANRFCGLVGDNEYRGYQATGG